MGALLRNNHPEIKAWYPQLFNSSPSVFSSQLSRMGVWHQLPVQICYRHSLPWRQQTLSGWQPLPQTRGEYFWNHPNSRGRTSCYKHTDTCMAGKKYYSFFFSSNTHKKNPQKNQGVFSPFHSFFWVSQVWESPGSSQGWKLTGILCFPSNCVTTLAGIWGGHWNSLCQHGFVGVKQNSVTSTWLWKGITLGRVFLGTGDVWVSGSGDAKGFLLYLEL